MMRKIILAAALATPFFGSAAANLVNNGSFENPALTTPASIDYAGSSTAITGWTVVGGNVQLVNASYIPSLSLTASEGSQWLDLTGMTEGFGKGVTSNSITTEVGKTYSLSFDVGTLAGRPNASVAYSINGDSGTFTNVGANSSGMNWASNTVTWVATATSAKLSFMGSSANNSNGTLIGLDNVTFTTAVPEPETYAMLLAGLGLMGAIARRRKAKQA